jgi:hypothetical protein
MEKIFRLCGLTAPLVYFAVVVMAGLAPGYSHLGQPISALYATGMPHGAQVATGFALYNLLVLGFAAGLRLWPRVALALAVTGLAGLVLALVPMDAAGAPMSPAGILHIILAAISSLASMATMLLAALALNATGHRRAARLTGLALALVFVSGGIAAMATANGWPLAGLYERLTIGSYLAWLLALALSLLSGRIAHSRPA